MPYLPVSVLLLRPRQSGACPASVVCGVDGPLDSRWDAHSAPGSACRALLGAFFLPSAASGRPSAREQFWLHLRTKQSGN